MKPKHGARYRVTGKRAFRAHQPGTEFVARLDAAQESRALLRGDIRVVERLIPTLPPGGYFLPEGWATPRKEN